MKFKDLLPLFSGSIYDNTNYCYIRSRANETDRTNEYTEYKVISIEADFDGDILLEFEQED